MSGEIPYLDFLGRDFSTRAPQVHEARAQNWCARTPFGLAVLRHRQVGLLLRDKRLRQGSYAWPDLNGLEGSFARFWKRSVISTEGETHRRLRNLAMPALSPDFIETLRPRFDAISAQLTDRLRENNRCEFVAEFATPFAGQAICTLLGMDAEDWQIISHDAADLGLAMGLDCKTHEEKFNAACDRLMKLAARLVDQARKGESSGSYVSRLVDRFCELEDISEQELLDIVVISIFGGVDTTRSQLGLAMGLFLQHPAQWQILRNDPSLIPQAIEEIIRASPTTTWVTREATEAFIFEGQQIEKGETLHMLVHASARDPAICENPEFDIQAKRKMHFGFGGGAHHCLGALVARTDIASALARLVETLESFEVDGEPQWLAESGNTGPIRLPIRYQLA